MSNLKLLSINELMEEKFFIPSYQRGYRWTKQQVEDLLNDINEFKSKEIEGKVDKTWYCLQPVVVKKRSENEWEVIDGQQRLTTVFLILHYLNKSKREKIFELNYETREDSTQYLKSLSNKVELNNSNIDYYFISAAYETIFDWFKKQENLIEKDEFESKFKTSTKIIWYETLDNQIDIFTRLNSGKIPLTNAELIKALFLNSSNFKNSDQEKLRLKQLEIATEWDRIEYALQDDAFWYFLNTGENNIPTRIELVFKLILRIEKEVDEYEVFRFFHDKFKINGDDSEDSVNKKWLEVKKCFQTLEEWYNDRELYHKIGFLISIGIKLRDIIDENTDKTKKEFRDSINKKIKKHFKKIELNDLEYNNKYIKDILLLHNIQTMLNNKNETTHFPFDRYKKEKWDIEHIHAIATKVNVKEKDFAEWLENNFVKSKALHKDKEKNDKIKKIIEEKKLIEKDKIDEFIAYVLGEEDNNIRNLCLLDRGTNRSYKNDSFKEKRRKIIEREKEGSFIPICTRNIFLKYYSIENLKSLEIWNENDRIDYLKSIRETLKDYLPKEAQNEQ